DAPVESCDEPAGPALLAENFELGDFEGTDDDRHFNGFRERPHTGVTVSIDATLAAQGSHSLKIEGGPGGSLFDLKSGVEHDLPNVKPSYIGYYVQVDQEVGWGGYLSLNTMYNGAANDAVALGNGYFTTLEANTSTSA